MTDAHLQPMKPTPGSALDSTKIHTSLIAAGVALQEHLCGPVFDLEVLDSSELVDVVGHERELEITGMRGDEEIIRAYHRSLRFERGADPCVVNRCLVWKIQDLDIPEILVDRRLLLMSPRRHFNSVEQFRLGDDGDAHGSDGRFLRFMM